VWPGESVSAVAEAAVHSLSVVVELVLINPRRRHVFLCHFTSNFVCRPFQLNYISHHAAVLN